MKCRFTRAPDTLKAGAEGHAGQSGATIGPDDATINRVNPVPTRVVETPVNPEALTSISWQVSSDIVATTPAPIAFNFCITDLKPILAQ